MKLSSILGIRGARDKLKNSYGGSAYSFFFGRSTSGKTVNERTAMQTTAVYSCVRILAETLEMRKTEMYVEGYKAGLVKDTSYKGLWKVSFTLKEF